MATDAKKSKRKKTSRDKLNISVNCLKLHFDPKIELNFDYFLLAEPFVLFCTSISNHDRLLEVASFKKEGISSQKHSIIQSFHLSSKYNHGQTDQIKLGSVENMPSAFDLFCLLVLGFFLLCF